MSGDKFRLITFEGCDRAGKETQSRLLVQRLNDDGIRAVRIETPWRDSRATYVLIRRMLNGGGARTRPYLFQLMQFVNKMHFQLTLMRQLIHTHDVIVLDRWDASMWAYGLATGVDEWTLRTMMNRLKRPDIRIYLRANPFVMPTLGDTYETDELLQRRVRNNYDSFADAVGVHVIDGNRPPEHVHRAVIEVIEQTGTLWDM